jgi:hypothetical protein
VYATLLSVACTRNSYRRRRAYHDRRPSPTLTDSIVLLSVDANLNTRETSNQLALSMRISTATLVRRMSKRRNRATATPLSPGVAPNDLWCADYNGEFRLGNSLACGGCAPVNARRY